MRGNTPRSAIPASYHVVTRVNSRERLREANKKRAINRRNRPLHAAFPVEISGRIALSPALRDANNVLNTRQSPHGTIRVTGVPEGAPDVAKNAIKSPSSSA